MGARARTWVTVLAAVGVVGALATAAHAQSTAPAVWTEVPLLNRRQGASFAALGNKVVLFGGLTSEEFGDMWEWDGAAWTRKTPSPMPSTRSNAAMAAYGNKLVLFGGNAGITTFDDTWEWDGTTWTQRTPATRPPPATPRAWSPSGASW